MSSFAYGFEMLGEVGAGRVAWFGNDSWVSFPGMEAKGGVVRRDAGSGMSVVIVGKFC